QGARRRNHSRRYRRGRGPSRWLSHQAARHRAAPDRRGPAPPREGLSHRSTRHDEGSGPRGARSRRDGDGHRRDRLRSSGREDVRAPQVLGGASGDARARVLPPREPLQPARDPAAVSLVHGQRAAGEVARRLRGPGPRRRHPSGRPVDNRRTLMIRLEQKVALVTGGYGGIGEAVSRGLAAAGARVAIAGHDGQKAERLAASMRGHGHHAFPAAFECLSPPAKGRMVDEVVQHFGRLDVLVNCVGLNREEKAEDVTEEKFDHVVDVNLRGAMLQAQAAARHLIRQETGGKQVHIGSVRTLLGLRGRGYAAYCASKGGLAILCKQLAAEWAPHQINVNVVAPTFVRTQQVAHMLADQQFYDALVARIPLGRIAEPEDVWNAVLFFVSSASAFVTGQTLYLDGGITATQ